MLLSQSIPIQLLDPTMQNINSGNRERQSTQIILLAILPNVEERLKLGSAQFQKVPWETSEERHLNTTRTKQRAS